MIYVAGAGALIEAARSMRRTQRDLDRRVARFKDKRHARRMARYGEQLATVDPRVDFPCATLCGACGYFLDAGEVNDSDNCPACGEKALIDLAVHRIADALADLEAEQRQKPLTVVQWGVLTGAIVLSFLLWPVFGGNAGFVLACAVATVLVPVTYLTVPRLLSWILLKYRPTSPQRWHLPLPLLPANAEPAETYRAVATTDDELLHAPVSGRPCIAYRVSAWFDAPGDARPPECALDEQRSVKLAAGMREVIDGDRFFLEGEPQPVQPPEDGDVAYDEFKRMARQRGIVLTAGEYEFFETIVEPGDTVEVQVFEGARYVVSKADAPLLNR